MIDKWWQTLQNLFSSPSMAYVGFISDDDFYDASEPETLNDVNLEELKKRIKDIESSYRRPKYEEPETEDDYFAMLKRKHYVSFDGSHQIRNETIRVYSQLCKFLDERLKKDHTSLLEIERQNKYGYYASDSILYCLFIVSKTQVIHFYKKQSKKVNGYYWKSIRKSIHHDVRFLKDELRELVQACPFPDAATRSYLRLNENGYPILWWDSDGLLRENNLYSLPQQQTLNMTMPRQTKVWENIEIRKEIIDLYLEVFAYVLEHKEDYKFSKTSQRVLERFETFDSRYLTRRRKKDISYSLMKVCESAIRRQIPSLPAIKDDEEREIIRRFMPKELLPLLYELIENKTIDTKAITLELLNDLDKAPAIQKALMLLDNETIVTYLLEYYSKDKNTLEKVLKRLIKESIDIDLYMVCIFLLSRLESHVPKLDQIIPKENMGTFTRLLQAPLTKETLDEVKTLHTPIRRRISLHTPDIEKSQEDLKQVVSIIEAYVGDDKLIENNLIPTLPNEIKQESAMEHAEIIKKLLRAPLTVQEIESYATKEEMSVKAYINTINKYLYPIYEDQVIIFEDDCYQIDEYFIEELKEAYND